MTTTVNARIRWFLIAFTIVVTMASIVVGIQELVGNIGRLGIETAGGSELVAAVGPGSPAEHAGIRVGDRIAIERMSLRDTLRTSNASIESPGYTLHLAFERNGVMSTRDIVLDSLYAVEPQQRTLLFSSILESVLIALLAIVVLARYSGGKAFALWALSSAWWMAITPWLYHPNADVALVAVLAADLLEPAIFVSGALIFALRAPRETAYRVRDERIVIGFGVFAGIVAAVCDTYLLIGRVEPPAILRFLENSFNFIVIAAIIVIMSVHLLRSTGAARIRLRWVAFGFAVLAVYAIFSQALTLVFPALQFAVWAGFIGIALTVVSFAAFAFSVTRSELFDIGFVVNRTAIYAVTTAALVGAFAGVNWLAGTVLKSTGIALPIEVLIAGTLGLTLNIVHKRVERAMDQIFFRRRYEAEGRLRRVARGLVHATELDVVAESVVYEICEALDLPSGALFRAHDDGLQQRLAQTGWDASTADVIAPRDRLLVHLGGADEWLALDGVPHDAAFPDGNARPRIAFALWSRRRLVGLALFSAHRSGAMLDPEEIEAIERVVTAAVAAFDRVDAERLNDALEEVALLREERDRLLQLVGIEQRALPSSLS
jgi:hypothetical protein